MATRDLTRDGTYVMERSGMDRIRPTKRKNELKKDPDRRILCLCVYTFFFLTLSAMANGSVTSDM